MYWGILIAAIGLILIVIAILSADPFNSWIGRIFVIVGCALIILGTSLGERWETDNSCPDNKPERISVDGKTMCITTEKFNDLKD